MLLHLTKKKKRINYDRNEKHQQKFKKMVSEKKEEMKISYILCFNFNLTFRFLNFFRVDLYVLRLKKKKIR